MGAVAAGAGAGAGGATALTDASEVSVAEDRKHGY